MKYLFYSLWLLLSLLSAGLTLVFMSANISTGTLLALALVVFYSFCFYRLIQSAYPSEPLLGNSDVGFWVFWLLIPLSVFLIKDGVETIVTDMYVPVGSPSRLRNRFMSLLAEQFGTWLPGTIALLMGLLLFTLCARRIFPFLKLKFVRR